MSDMPSGTLVSVADQGMKLNFPMPQANSLTLWDPPGNEQNGLAKQQHVEIMLKCSMGEPILDSKIVSIGI